MRRIFLRQMTHDDLTKLIGERRPKVKKPLTDLRAFGVVISILVGVAAVGVCAFALLAWLAWDNHEFGPRDLRYLVFIRGTLTERVGAIDAEPGTVSYRGQGRDGTASGYIRASYTSAVDGTALLARFAERCKAVGLPHVKLNEQPSADGGRTLVCGRNADDEYVLGVTVNPTKPTEVVMAEDIED
jgi:hypothetical protein